MGAESSGLGRRIKGDHLWLLEKEPTYMRRHMQLILQDETIKSSERRVAYRMILG